MYRLPGNEEFSVCGVMQKKKKKNHLNFKNKKIKIWKLCSSIVILKLKQHKTSSF